MSPPWMPLYIADYLKDTTRLSTSEHGAYLLLIMDYWANGGLPTDEEELQRITRMTDREWAKSRERLKRLFREDWNHKRIDEELAKSADLSSKRKANARARWGNRTSNSDANGDANASSMNDANSMQLHTHAGVARHSSQFTPPSEGSSSVSKETSDAPESDLLGVPPPKDPDAELYRLGREVLGADSGALVTKLRQAKGGSVPLALDVLRMASRKDDPRRYVMGALKNGAARTFVGPTSDGDWNERFRRGEVQ